MKQVIGVIGGSGLYEMEGLTKIKSIKITTPFGKPSLGVTVRAKKSSFCLGSSSVASGLDETNCLNSAVRSGSRGVGVLFLIA